MTAGLVALITVVAFEAIAIATAMPVAARELGGLREYGLAFSLFLTTSLFGVVAAGGWNDRRGPRGPIAVSLLLFCGGLVISGTASGFAALLLGRAVAGAGGGMIGVSLYVVVAQVYPQDVQPRVFGALSAAWVLPSVIGPVIAGWLTEVLSWRAVFLGVPPIAVVFSLVLWRRLPAGGQAAHDEVGPAGPRLLRGVGLAVGALGVQLGLQAAARGGEPAGQGAAGGGPASQEGELALLDPGIGWGIAVAGAVLLLLCLPALLPAGALRLARGLPSLVAVRAGLAGAFFGAEAFVPLMLVERRGLSPTVAGLVLTGAAVGWASGSWLQGRPRLPVARTRLLSIGAAAVGAAVALLCLIAAAGLHWWLVVPIWMFSGCGMGLAMSSASVLLIRLSEPGEQGRNASGLQIGDGLGSVLALGAAGAVLAALHTADGVTARPFILIWAGLAGVGLVAAIAATRVATRRTTGGFAVPAGG